MLPFQWNNIHDTKIFQHSIFNPFFSSDLETFEKNLHEFTNASTVRCLAAFAFADAVGTSTIVSSVEFDKDYELFAVAGVSKRIKIYDYTSIVADGMHMHFPLIEMNSSAKISSVVWNDFLRNHIACADYDGGVTVWDALTGKKTNAFQVRNKGVRTLRHLLTDD